MSHSESRAIVSLAALYIVRMLGLFMVLPVLSLAGGDYSGSNLFLLGLALGIYGLTQALLQIPFGVLSDRFGRKPLIAIGLVIFALGSLIAATAQTIEGLLIGRVLQGAGAIAGVIMAMVSDLTGEQNRTKAMASIGASIGVAFALSLVLGPVLMSWGGVRWIFLLTLILAVAALVILFVLVPAESQREESSSSVLQGLGTVLSHRELLRLNLGIFVLHAVLMALFVALPLILESVNIVQKHHSWVYLGLMASAFFMMVPLIIFGERFQYLKRIFLSVLLVTVVALFALAFVSHDALLVLLALLLFFIGFNYLEATLPSLMSKTVPSELRGAGSGAFSTSQFLGAACGGLLGGWLYEDYGAVSLMLVLAALVFCWWLLSLRMSVPPRSERSH